MIIAVDIGNSSINIGYFTEKGLLIQKIETHPLRKSGEYAPILKTFIEENSLEKGSIGVIISPVVIDHTGVLREAFKELEPEEIMIMGPEIKTGLIFDIPRPEELGSDRIANAVAAYEYHGSPVAVVDFGTATTISIVGKEANYIGGAILPGIRLMNESLARGTSKLSEVKLSPPEFALGTDTAGCIQSGLFYGTAGATERLLSEIEKETGLNLKVVVTGGFGNLLSGFLPREHYVVPNLTIEGLKIIYMRNSNA
ncbi:MAG: type III pantothenate kinase [Nitrospirota bacterium]